MLFGKIRKHGGMQRVRWDKDRNCYVWLAKAFPTEESPEIWKSFEYELKEVPFSDLTLEEMKNSSAYEIVEEITEEEYWNKGKEHFLHFYDELIRFAKMDAEAAQKKLIEMINEKENIEKLLEKNIKLK